MKITLFLDRKEVETARKWVTAIAALIAALGALLGPILTFIQKGGL